jgi:hypothetical protein
LEQNICFSEQLQSETYRRYREYISLTAIATSCLPGRSVVSLLLSTG